MGESKAIAALRRLVHALDDVERATGRIVERDGEGVPVVAAGIMTLAASRAGVELVAAYREARGVLYSARDLVESLDDDSPPRVN